MSSALPDWLTLVPRDRLLRIDLGLEGDWSATVTTVWRPGTGFLGLGTRPWRHADYRPALELYLEDGWIGVRCERRDDRGFDVDEPRLLEVIRWVESQAIPDA
jgi:hypothetical protein